VFIRSDVPCPPRYAGYRAPVRMLLLSGNNGLRPCYPNVQEEASLFMSRQGRLRSEPKRLLQDIAAVSNRSLVSLDATRLVDARHAETSSLVVPSKSKKHVRSQYTEHDVTIRCGRGSKCTDTGPNVAMTVSVPILHGACIMR
jgi:hypothetical protein